MGTKLYVGNLPYAPSVVALRAHFSACGIVSDVQIVPDRNAGRGRGSAFVRMGNAMGAERARSELNGSSFGGQFLLVEAAPDDVGEKRGSHTRRGEPKEDDARTRITSQFRESANMTYELDCSGVTLALRVFFPNDTGEWRIVAQSSREADAPSTAAAAPSRREALKDIARVCREGAGVAALGGVDWDAVEEAMLKVRAI